jgi:ABC-type transport system involved in multi-copper enzyme maturation permease subunit
MEYITLGLKVVRYNLKIIFAGKFFWFLLASFAFFAYFMFNLAWNRGEINEGAIYQYLYFSCLLLIFYPVVFGIQNDEDNRTLELIFGIPNYRYKIWGVRMLMMYVANYFILVLFSYVAYIMMYPINIFEMSAQLLFPMLFFGNLAFMFSTITRSGNGTAVLMILIGFVFFTFVNSGGGGSGGSPTASMSNSFWNVFINPFSMPTNIHPMIWQNIIIKSRIFLALGGIVFLMIGLLNLQKREKFI